MFKKLMSFLFEEEEIIEEVAEKPTKTKEVVPTFKDEEIQDEVKEDVEPVKNKSIFVDSDEPKPVASLTQSTFKANHNDEAKRVKIEPKKQTEYEFSSSISPIFGKLPEKEREAVQIQPKIDLVQEKSILGTIISPIYGIKKRQKVSNKVEKPVVVNTTMSLEDILGVNEQSVENTQQLTFDDQEIKENNQQEKPKEDILMQLFEEENVS